MPEELWMEVHNIVQKTGIKTILKKKKRKKANWLAEETLQIAMKRREAKSKGGKERYTHLNAEFQRIARRDKAFLSDQCKEIEENNRMAVANICWIIGKAREFPKNIYFCFIDYAKAFDSVDHNKPWKIPKESESFVRSDAF